MNTINAKIEDLKPHPLQQDVYGDLSAIQFESLKADIATAGVLQPPEVSVDMVIIDGHQRIKACQELGIDHVEVLVRKDLNEHDVNIRFFKANHDRRQLGPVEKARVYKAIFEAEYHRQGRRLHPETDSAFRSFVAKHLQISEKTVERHLRLLRLPRAIQDAVSAGKLGMIKALDVAKLPGTKQKEIEQRIESGENAASVVNELFTKPPKKVFSSKELFQQVLNLLSNNVAEFEAEQLELAEIVAGCKGMTSIVDRSCDFLVQLHGLAVNLENAKPKRSGKATKAIQRPR